MKVAIVQEQIDMRRGGAETSTLEMARHLATLGLRVTVVCSAGTPTESDHQTTRLQGARDRASSKLRDAHAHVASTPDDSMRPAVKLHAIPVTGHGRTTRTMRFLAEAHRFCDHGGFNVVHAITPCLSCNLYQPRGGTYVETIRRSVARGSGPLMRLIRRLGRCFNWRQRFLMLLERQILAARQPPMIAAVSEYVAQQVRHAFPACPPDRLRVVFNGVDIEPLPPAEAASSRTALRQELGVSETTPLALFMAHNFKLKGLRELIDAMSVRPPSGPSPAPERTGHPQSEPEAQATGRNRDEGRPGPDYVLAVVGRDHPATYRRFARLRGVLDRVHFLGPRDDPPALYAAADVLAHPTWYDPCSRVVLEALCCGLPVVTTRFNGAAEVIEDGTHGLVIASPRDTPALAAAITRCLQPDLRAACQAQAAPLRARLSMARHAQELRALYREIAVEKA